MQAASSVLKIEAAELPRSMAIVMLFFEKGNGTMSEAPLKGNFIAGQNRGKEPGSKLPDFTGRISIPGREEEHGMALWVRKDRNGKPYFSGRMDAMPLTDDIAAQIDRLAEPNATGEILEAGPNLTLEPYQVILFTNKFKKPQETDSPEETAKRTKRPDFWGRVNPGGGSPVVAISVWLTQDRYKHPLLTGSTSCPQPGKENAAALETDMIGQDPQPRRRRKPEQEQGPELV